MDQSDWNRGIYSSRKNYVDNFTSEHFSSFQHDPMQTNSDSDKMKMFPETVDHVSGDAGSSVIFSSQLELNASKDGTTGRLSTRRHPSPASSSCGYHDWDLDSGHQAKRARVENIIKGMTSSPGRHCTDVMTSRHEESDGIGVCEMIQELPSHQDREGSGSPSHNWMTQKEFRGQPQHLRTRLNHMDSLTDNNGSVKEEKYPSWYISQKTFERGTSIDSCSEFENSSSRNYQDWKKVKLMNFFQSKPERIKLMADVLKYELSEAVGRSVDSIFKGVPLLQNEGDAETNEPLWSLGCKDLKSRPSYSGNAMVDVSDVQIEALSLVVQKPVLERVEKSGSRHHHCPSTPESDLSSHDLVVHDHQPSEKSLNAGRIRALRRLQDRCSRITQAKLETFDARWDSVKVRPKVNSRSVRSPQSHNVSVEPMFLESLCFPAVKIESNSLAKTNLYMPHEGLTTYHLKKAKLMFFYTRYPSSLVLKMCFHDVQFTRCITSQLIKWFSNFREFFYIQMEKFARHALTEGAANVAGLNVGRESELFRALNIHYNKANDFQVPDRFLEVAEIALREFYAAISVGKDRDQSWKKTIYKVICKLDSDVPAEFKTHPTG